MRRPVQALAALWAASLAHGVSTRYAMHKIAVLGDYLYAKGGEKAVKDEKGPRPGMPDSAAARARLTSRDSLPDLVAATGPLLGHAERQVGEGEGEHSAAVPGARAVGRPGGEMPGSQPLL